MVEITAEVQKLNSKTASQKIKSFQKSKKIVDIVIPVPLMEKGKYLVVTIPASAVKEMTEKASELPPGKRVDFVNDWIKDNIHSAIDQYVESGRKKFRVGEVAAVIKATPKPLPYTYEEKGQKYLVLTPKKAEAAPKTEAEAAEQAAPSIAAKPTVSKPAQITVSKVEIESAKPSKPKAKTAMPETKAELPKYELKESAEEKMKKAQGKWMNEQGVRNLTPSSSHQGLALKKYYGKGYKFIATIETGKKKEKDDVILPIKYAIEGGPTVNVLFIIQIPENLTTKDIDKMVNQMTGVIVTYPAGVKGISKINVKKDINSRLTKALKSAGYEIM